ncbi:MAG: TolC family protein [Bacteroidetes bacterium]|nr:TolC family protein [Bacteroidota bacterium]
MSFLIANFTLFAQQKKGKYIPTKYDSVKKVIPPQFYGNAAEAKRADSIAKAEAMQKQLAQKEKEALEKKMAEQKLLEEAEKKKNANKQIPKITNIKENTYTPYTRPPQKKPIEKQVSPKPLPIVKKETPQKVKKLKTIWNLADCIEYAKKNNLQIVEAQLNERYEKLLYEENKNSRYPDLNGDLQIGKSFGRNIDPASNQFVNNNFNYNTLGLWSNTLLFGWFQKKYQLEKNQLDIQSAEYANKKLQDDVTLNITTGYIRVLQAREQKKSLALSLKKFTDRNVYMNKNDKQSYQAMLSTDSAMYLETVVNERMALLQLKALLHLEFEDAFDIATDEDEILTPKQGLSMPDAAAWYQMALNQQAQVQYEHLKLKSVKKSLDIAKAMQYPQLSLYGGAGTVFSSNVKNITAQTYEGESSVGYVNINGSSYPVTNSQYQFTTITKPLADQYNDHIRATVGLRIAVPLLNGYASRANIQKAKIALVSQQLQVDVAKQALKNDIYKTYEEAIAASQKYTAYLKARDESALWMESLGKQNNDNNQFLLYKLAWQQYHQNATQATFATYEWLFKLKMLDYFSGNPIKME